MPIDPSLLDSFPAGPDGERARDFIKAIVRGTFYVSATPSGGGPIDLACQTKDQDGKNINKTWGKNASFTKAGSVITLVSTGTKFTAGMVGSSIIIADATTAGNNGTFTIASFISETSVTYTNAGGVSETGAGTCLVPLQTDVLVRTHALLPTNGTITVSGGGTDQTGSGTNICWLKTSSTGAFTATITALAGVKVLVELVPTPGETTLVPLQF
jgi:hypothetical protein